MSEYLQYDREQIQGLIDEIDLFEYASSTMDFERRGRDSYACSCPLHVDETPSLFITPSKNKFYCQSCKRGGSIIEWLMSYEHLNFRQAIEKMEALAGHKINCYKVSDTMKVFRQFKQAQIKPLTKTTEERKILPKDYYLKFEDELPQEWLDEGISPEEMKKYEIRIDKYANRIVYPVYDKDFNLIGVKGRTRIPDYKEKHIAKYMNYTQITTTDYFTGMKQAEKYIKSSLQVILVEGIKSVMKIDGWGFHNVVSAEHSKINIEQVIILIQMGIKEVVIAFDKDVPLDEIKVLANKLTRYCNVYAVIDKHKLLDDKMSPCDRGLEVWQQLWNERVRI